MAASKKSPATEEERKQRAREKARQRKKRFVDKVRKASGGDGLRRGSVLYLSDDARAVLTRNRNRRKDLGLPQVLDANLVESLLKVYAEQGEPEHPLGPLVLDETKANAVVAKLLTDKADLEQQLKSRPKPVALDWNEIERKLLAAHHLMGTQWVRGIAQRVLLESASGASESGAAAALQYEIAEHIRSLIEWVLEQG